MSREAAEAIISPCEPTRLGMGGGMRRVIDDIDKQSRHHPWLQTREDFCVGKANRLAIVFRWMLDGMTTPVCVCLLGT